MKQSEERIEAMIDDGMIVTKEIGHFPSFSEYAVAKKKMKQLKFSEWQIYRAFNGDSGAWETFQYLLMERQNSIKN